VIALCIYDLLYIAKLILPTLPADMVVHYDRAVELLL
jgi:hypothetical protein